MQLSKKFSEERVLTYFEGPLIVLYRNEAKEPYVGLWVDKGTDGTNRWLLFRTTEPALARYLRRKMPLLDVLADTPDDYVFIRDINSNGVLGTWLVEVSEIPVEIRPQAGALHDPDFEPPYEGGVGEDAILIDGKWDMPKLSFLQRRYSQVYAICSLFGAKNDNSEPALQAIDTIEVPNRLHEDEDVPDELEEESVDEEVYDDEEEEELALEPDVKRPRTIDRYRYNGGFIYKTVYDQIEKMVPYERRPKLKAVHYASPGYLRLTVDEADAARTREALRTFIDDAEALSKSYDRVHALIVEYGKWKKKNIDNPHGEGGWEADFRPYVERFSRSLNLSVEAILTVTVTYRVAGVLLASHYRKLQDLARLQLNDMDML